MHPLGTAGVSTDRTPLSDSYLASETLFLWVDVKKTPKISKFYMLDSY